MPGSLGSFLGQLRNDSDIATICKFAPRSVRACVPPNVTLRVRSGLWPIPHEFRVSAVAAGHRSASWESRDRLDAMTGSVAARLA